MSMVQCRNCPIWLDPKESPETYREELDDWVCERCWDEHETREYFADSKAMYRQPA